jgi:antitoxin component YwqK of YwqJK toxin-antitoxin module
MLQESDSLRKKGDDLTMTIRLALTIIIFGVVQNVSGQTFQVFKGDTINRIDLKGRKQGLWKKYYQTDTLFMEGVYKDGKHSGTFKTYHKNGQKQSVLKFRGLTEVSDAVLYNDSAQLIAKGKYIVHDKDSVWIYYNGTTGNISSEERYKKGVEEGIWKVFYPNGQVAELVTYKAGIKSGPYIKYFENGKPKMEGKMEKNLLEGKVTLYYSNGKIWQQGIYKSGDKQGIWNIYKEDGNLEKQEEFNNGLLKEPAKMTPLEGVEDPDKK